MEGFKFASSLTQDEYKAAQRLVAQQKPGIYFLVYVWPKLGYALGTIVAFAGLMLQATKGYGGSIVLPIGGFFVGSALWLHYGTQHRISDHFRSAGLWHKMAVNADAVGISMDCENGTKSSFPWHVFSNVLARDSVLVLMQTPARFAVISLAELDQPHREDLVQFVRKTLAKHDVEV